MTEIIFPFSLSAASLETVGGKGLSLVRMSQAGFPVPPGFIVTTEAYRSFVSSNGLQSRILKAVDKTDPTDTAGLDSASQAISAMFTQGSIPPEVAAEIGKAYQAFQDRPVAVRSSATAEDLPDASFAGQQETYLNIRGFNALLEAVKKCWASLWTARAISYRITNQIDPANVALAVVVQEMVFADAAGVMFTANPVNGHRNEVLINAAWGLGEAVVSGAVTPDTLTVEKTTGKILERLTAEKEVMTVRTESGTEERPVPANRRKTAVLSKAQVTELAALGKKIEEYYSMPMDIEWTISNGKFAIVQARPITSLPPDWTLPEAKTMYARSSLAEHIPGPVTPLFGTLGLRLANEETARMFEAVFGSEYTRVLTSAGMYVPFHGYVYYGVKMDGAGAWLMVKASFNQIGPMFRGSVPRWVTGRREFLNVVETWEAREPRRMTPGELLEGARAVFRAAARYFTVLQACLPAASSSEVIFTRFYKSLVKRKGDPDASIFLVGFESGALRTEKSLYGLAEWLHRTDPRLVEYIKQAPIEELLEGITSGRPRVDLPPEAWGGFSEQFQQHLSMIGRTSYEFDFSNPTPSEMPGLQLEAVKNFLDGHSTGPDERQKQTAGRRDNATEAVTSRLGWPLKGWFTRLLKWARETSVMREDGIADMGLGHPVIRRMLGELGRRLAGQDALSDAGDVYWLTETELETAVAQLEAGSRLSDYSGLIPPRKKEWEERLIINPPMMMPEKSGWSKLFHGGEAKKVDGLVVLTGVGTSAGIITAPARVLFGPEDFHRMQPGDVLVAVTTTPAWTPLFTLASAVVTDIGGPLSHSSIVAREFGIPAVMSTRSATRQIRDGQMVTVDGGKGTVTLSE